jgi:hypothetical protein
MQLVERRGLKEPMPRLPPDAAGRRSPVGGGNLPTIPLLIAFE